MDSAFISYRPGAAPALKNLGGQEIKIDCQKVYLILLYCFCFGINTDLRKGGGHVHPSSPCGVAPPLVQTTLRMTVVGLHALKRFSMETEKKEKIHNVHFSGPLRTPGALVTTLATPPPSSTVLCRHLI